MADDRQLSLCLKKMSKNVGIGKKCKSEILAHYGISLLAYYLANLNLLLELSNKYSKYVLKYFKSSKFQNRL